MNNTDKKNRVTFVLEDYYPVNSIVKDNNIGYQRSISKRTKDKREIDWPDWGDSELSKDLLEEAENVFFRWLLMTFVDKNKDSISIGENQNRIDRKDHKKPELIISLGEEKKINGVVGAISGKFVWPKEQKEEAFNKTIMELIVDNRTSKYKEQHVKIELEEIEYSVASEFSGIDFLKAFKLSSFYIEIKIKSRFDKTKPFFAATMLSCGAVNGINDLLDNWDEDGLLDFLLITIFANNLQNAMQKGVFKKYQYFEGNDDRIKGSIDIARHIKLNIGKSNGCIAYKYRENTQNNSFNALIIKTFQYAKRKYPGVVSSIFNEDLQRYIKELENKVPIDRYSFSTIIRENIKPISHPFYIDYEKVRKVCFRILRDEGISIFETQTNEEINGCLFYLPDLWENYLEKEVFDNNKFTIEAQYPEQYIQNKKGNGFFLFGNPDFVFKKGDDICLILDAKEKPWWAGAIDDTGIPYGDSDVTKCMRDQLVCGADGSGVVFPMETGNYSRDSYKEINVKRMISDDNRKKHGNKQFFCVLPLFVSNSDTYSKWKEEMEKNIEVFNDVLTEIVNSKKSMSEPANNF